MWDTFRKEFSMHAARLRSGKVCFLSLRVYLQVLIEVLTRGSLNNASGQNFLGKNELSVYSLSISIKQIRCSLFGRHLG